MDKTTNKWMTWVFSAFVCLLACGLYYHFFVNKAYVEIELEVAQKTDFKIYWAGTGQPYSEKKMAVTVATPNRKHYSFFLTDIGQVARLRVDPHAYQGEATLKRVFIRQEGWAPISLATPKEFDQLVPLTQIIEYGMTQDGLMVKSTGKDPNLELLVTPHYLGREIRGLVLRFAAIIFVIFLVINGAGKLVQDLRFVPLLLFGVWTLIIVMAGTSQENVHPDEYVHIQATSYYRDHWLPPVIEDLEIRPTYSCYGVSRLNNGEIYYLFAGKFNKLLDGFQLPSYLSLRIFNIFLFALLLLFTIKNQYARMVAIPFLLSPQIWYLFSYCNSDAFGLFCAFIAGCLLVDPDSILHRYFKDDKWMSVLAGGIMVSLLLGSLFLLKKNYYPFILFFYLCIGATIFQGNNFVGRHKRSYKRLALITLAGLLILGLRVGADYKVNGLDRQEKLVKMQEELADPWYKPSTPLHEQHFYLNMKERGTSLQKMIQENRWFEKSFQSGFGVFGYLTITASNTYYDLIRWTGVLLLAFVFGSIFLRGTLIDRGLAISVLGLSAMLIGVSLYHSWTADFQAQGRYLFPIIPMLGILLATSYKTVNNSLLTLGVTTMYLLGIYSFIFQAIMHSPKVVFP